MTKYFILPAVVATSVTCAWAASPIDEAANAVSTLAQPNYSAMAAVDVGSRNHVDVMVRAANLTQKAGSDFVGYYGEYTAYDDTTIVGGGVKLFNYVSQGFGGQAIGTFGSFGLSLTSSDKFDYDRFGGELSFGVMVPISGEQLHIDAGIILRPIFLSSEADTDATAEYGYSLGVSYRLTQNVATYGQYTSEGIWDDSFDAENLDNGVSVGVRLTF